MTKEKAVTKICPIITDNQGMYEKVPSKCIVEDCMAWVDTGTEDGKETGYCSQMSEPDDVIIGVDKGALDKTNMIKFLKGQPFEFNGNKEHFLIVKRR